MPKDARPSKISVGDVVPDHTLTNQNGEKVSLRSLVKDQGAVFFLYPRANTPGCTTQACGFKDHHEELIKKGYQVFGLSADKPAAQSKWKTKHSLPYDLLCDPEYHTIKALGCAKSPSGITRSHIIVGKGGIIEDIQIKVSPKVSIEKATEFILKE